MNENRSTTRAATAFRGRLIRFRRVLRRLGILVAALAAFYGLLCLIGLWPVNRNFQPTRDGVEIFVTSNGVHTDFVLPVQYGEHDWREMFPAEHFAEHSGGDDPYVGFGWGDLGIYLETPTWVDLKASTAVKAVFWPTPSVMHVTYCLRPTEHADCRRLVLSPDQYRQLREFIVASFKPDARGAVQAIPGVHYPGMTDAFYPARGRYHLLNTCNCWTGDGLRRIGAPTSLWTPFTYWVMRPLRAAKTAPDDDAVAAAAAASAL